MDISPSTIAFLLIFSLFLSFLFILVLSDRAGSQNIGCIPCVLQCIFEPILPMIVCIFHCPTPVLLLSAAGDHWFVSISVSAFFFFFNYIHQFAVFFQILHIHDIIQYVFLCLISLSIMPSRCIHVAANGKISFFFMIEKYFTVYIYHFFIHLLMDTQVTSIS